MKFSKDKILYKLKTNVFFIILILGAVFNDLILRALTVKKIFYWKPLFTTVGIILLLSIFVWFVNYKNRKNIFIVLSGIFSLISSLNYVYYKYYNSFLSFSLLKQLENIGEIKSSVFKTLDIKMFIFFIPTFIMIFMVKKLKAKEFFEKLGHISKKTEFVLPLCTGCFLLLVVFTTLTQTDKSRLVKQWNRPYLVEQLGIYSFTTADFVKNISANKVDEMEEQEIIDIMGKLKNENEISHIKNEYTNIFEGKDVYVIHYESAQTFPMELEFDDGPVTPFLNKLASEGLYFENFYPQHSVGTSSDSEFSFNTSLLPINNGTVFMTHADREYISLQKLLKEKGYYAFSMHGNNGDFWNRNVMHSTLGYDKFYSKNDYNIDEEIGLGLSDMSFYRQSIDKIKEIKEEQKKPIMATLITLTNHYPFEDTDKYGEFNVGHLEGTDIGNYLKSYHYADKSLQSLVENMDKEGLLDNAIIVLYGDHHAKISKEDYEKVYGYSDELNTTDEETFKLKAAFSKKLKRTPFIIWSKDSNIASKVSTPMGMIDAMPTLSNMLGVYNPYCLGKDIMSIEKNTVVFPDGSWLDENYYYSASSSKLYSFESNELIEEPYDLKESEDILEKIDVSNKIIQNDLIKLYNNKSLNYTVKDHQDFTTQKY